MNKKLKSFNIKIYRLVWMLFLPLGILLFTGCSSYSTMKKTTKRMIRDYKAPDGDLKKRVGIAFFENKTTLVGKGLEENVIRDLVETMKASCGDILVLGPDDSDYPNDLVTLPRQASGLIDNFDLAKTGRHLGLNAVVTGALIDITNHKEVRGILWFKDTHNYVQVQVMTEVYDIQTESGQYLSNNILVHNCFIISVEDDLVNPGGIMDLVTAEARLFKYGSGTGTNFSNIRGEGEPLYELYDLNDEPVEVRDVYDDLGYRARRDALVADLDAWYADQTAKYPQNPVSYHR